jgi:hypothetical protein
VVTNRPSVVYHLSEPSLAEMERRDPEAAAVVHKYIARVLAERLAQANKALEALLD